jgi:hypothetical protein
MTIPKAIGTTVVCGLVLCAVGGLLGGTLGAFIPGYYRSVFRGGHEPGFDPIAVGIGQGATQGTTGGVIAGLILVGIVAWRERRLSRTGPDQEKQDVPVERRVKPWGWMLIIAGAGLLLSVGSCSVGVVVGALIGEQGVYDSRYREEKQLIEEALASDPLVHRIQIEPRSNGGVLIYGAVQRQADHDRLRELLTRILGEPRAREIVAGVDVLATPDMR